MSTPFTIIRKHFLIKTSARNKVTIAKIQQFQNRNAHDTYVNSEIMLALVQLQDQKRIPDEIINNILTFVNETAKKDYYKASVNLIHMYCFYGNKMRRGRMLEGGRPFNYRYTNANFTLTAPQHYIRLAPHVYPAEEKIVLDFKNYVSQIKINKTVPGDDCFNFDQYIKPVEKAYSFNRRIILSDCNSISLINRSYDAQTIDDVNSILALLAKLKNKRLQKALIIQLNIKTAPFWIKIKESHNSIFSYLTGITPQLLLTETNRILIPSHLFIKELKKNGLAVNEESLFTNRDIQFPILKNAEIFSRLGDYECSLVNIGHPHHFVLVKPLSVTSIVYSTFITTYDSIKQIIKAQMPRRIQ